MNKGKLGRIEKKEKIVCIKISLSQIMKSFPALAADIKVMKNARFVIMSLKNALFVEEKELEKRNIIVRK